MRFLSLYILCLLLGSAYAGIVPRRADAPAAPAEVLHPHSLPATQAPEAEAEKPVPTTVTTPQSKRIARPLILSKTSPKTTAGTKRAMEGRLMYFMIMVGLILVLSGVGYLFWSPVWAGLSMMVAGGGILACSGMYIISLLAGALTDSWELDVIKTLSVMSVFGLLGLGILAGLRLPFFLTFAGFSVAWIAALGLSVLLFSMLMVLSYH